MNEQVANQANRVVFTAAQARQLRSGQPYISHISFNDWTGGHPHLMHCHPDMMELLLLYKGSGRYSVGLHQYEVAAGDVIICNGGELHDEFPDQGAVYQTICMGVKELHLPGLPDYCVLPTDRVPVFRQSRQFQELAGLMLMIERHAKEKRPCWQMLCQHLAEAVLELVGQMIREAENAEVDAPNALCAAVEEYIYRHYTEDITIEQLGRRFAVSPYHLAHVFKENTGYTIKQSILRRRVGEAQNRLIFAQDSIAAIAAQVGFADAGYFSRVFTKFVGLPPTEYRTYRRKQEEGKEP